MVKNAGRGQSNDAAYLSMSAKKVGALRNLKANTIGYGAPQGLMMLQEHDGMGPLNIAAQQKYMA